MRFTSASLNDIGDQWRAVAVSALLAAKHFNQRNATLLPAFGNLAGCSVKINVSAVENTASDPATSVNAYLAGTQAGQCSATQNRWHMFIGAARSACSTPTAMLGALQGIPQVSYWSTSPDLDSTEYPYFSRVIPPDTATSKALVAFIRQNNWRNVGMQYI